MELHGSSNWALFGNSCLSAVSGPLGVRVELDCIDVILIGQHHIVGCELAGLIPCVMFERRKEYFELIWCW